MDEEYTINHYSLSLPAGPGKDNIPDLLRHLAASIEKKQGDKDIWIQDIVFDNEVDVNGEFSPSFTVYYTIEE